MEGASRSETVNVGATPVALALGASGTEAGVVFPADMSQQDERAGAPWTLTGDAGAPIMWQWGTPLLAAGIWSKHGERAVACNARSMIASVKATSLERRFMILN
jgi:hypothetical protein